MRKQAADPSGGRAFFSCFNGAALFQVRKLALALPRRAVGGVLQWGRTFSSAETTPASLISRETCSSFNGAALFQVRKRIVLYFCRIRISSFNGAALFQVRKPRPLNRKVSPMNGLQWGRTFSSAETTGVVPSSLTAAMCFNGAALFQVRKHTVRLDGCQGKKSFNGAALFQVRKRRKEYFRQKAIAKLQWGRTFSSAETETERLC